MFFSKLASQGRLNIFVRGRTVSGQYEPLSGLYYDAPSGSCAFKWSCEPPSDPYEPMNLLLAHKNLQKTHTNL